MTAAARQVSVEERRAILVGRQLLGRAGRSTRSVEDVATGLVALHSTDPAVPYLSVHARADVAVTAVEDALYEMRSLLRVTTLRRTVFVMTHDVAADAVGAYNPGLVTQLRRQLLTWIEASPDVATDAGAFLAAVEDEVVTRLRDGGPATGAQLAAAVPGLQVRFEPAPGKDYSKPMRITTRVLELLAAECRIVRGRPTGDLTSGAWTWASVDDWLPGGLPGGLPAVAPAEALAGLVDRYLAAFGPATLGDITWWTGLGKTPVRAALGAIGAVEVALEGLGEPGFLLPHDPLVTGGGGRGSADDEAPTIALLPGLDPTTMGWKQRSWYVDDTPAGGLFDRSGNAGPTIWVDGRVVGAWSQRPDGEIAHRLLVDLGADVARAVAAEAARLADWLGPVRVRWRFPTPLSKELSV